MITNIELDLYFTWYIILQTVDKINASLQKLLSGNQYQHTNKTKSKKGLNSATILWMITNIELDLYFTRYILLQAFNKINASLQKLLIGNQYQHSNKNC